MPAIDLSEIPRGLRSDPYGVLQAVAAGYVFSVGIPWDELASHTMTDSRVTADFGGGFAITLEGEGLSKGSVMGTPIALDHGTLHAFRYSVDGRQQVAVTDLDVDLAPIYRDIIGTRGDLGAIFDVFESELTALADSGWTVRGAGGADVVDPVTDASILGFRAAFRGDDTFLGRGGDDLLSGGHGSDVLHGGAGRDVLEGGRGADRLRGDGGGDALDGGAGRDVLNGGRGGDVVRGRGGDDRMLGGSHSDTLRGGAGDDALFGGRGGDRLVGGAGDDRLVGGTGADVFVFARGSGRDVIDDFSLRQGDRLDLGGIDPRATAMDGGAGVHLEWRGGELDVFGLDATDLHLAFV